MTYRVFIDCFGRELEARTCEYCGTTKPIATWSGIENCRGTFNVLMTEYTGREGHKVWICKECATDIENKSQGKEN